MTMDVSLHSRSVVRLTSRHGTSTAHLCSTRRLELLEIVFRVRDFSSCCLRNRIHIANRSCNLSLAARDGNFSGKRIHSPSSLHLLLCNGCIALINLQQVLLIFFFLQTTSTDRWCAGSNLILVLSPRTLRSVIT